MIIVTTLDATPDDVDRIRERVESLGLRTHLSRGETHTVIGCIGDEEKLDHLPLRSLPGVAHVHRVMKPFKLAAREFAAGPSRVSMGDVEVGGQDLVVIAGPCSVEGEEMILESADAVRAAGGKGLRGGAFKPRTSPYSFNGLGVRGLELLAQARERSGLPVVTEVMDTRQVQDVAGHADVLQVGARNMQNFALLTEVGRVHRPVLLKRGMSSTIRDLLLAAEYVMKQGNMDVILCERGIRTFETATRNTFDLAAIPVLKAETHLPVIADPSHAGGRRELVAPLSFAAIAAGADGLMVEIHPEPSQALSDGDQSLNFDEFREFMVGLQPFAAAAGRRLSVGDRTPARAAVTG